jgi:hypothetical protein
VANFFFFVSFHACVREENKRRRKFLMDDDVEFGKCEKLNVFSLTQRAWGH